MAFQRNVPPAAISAAPNHKCLLHSSAQIQPSAIQVRYQSCRRPPAPKPIFRTSNPGGESLEKESVIEESLHLLQDIADLESELKPLRATHRSLMDQFNVKHPNIDGSSAPLILTRTLEAVRVEYEEICAQEATLTAEFSTEERGVLNRTVAEQHQLFEALRSTVDELERDLVELEGRIDDPRLRARRAKYEAGNRTQQALQAKLEKLRDEIWGGAVDDQQSQIDELANRLEVLRQQKGRRQMELQRLQQAQVQELEQLRSGEGEDELWDANLAQGPDEKSYLFRLQSMDFGGPIEQDIEKEGD
jgi:chromosome segregation ATPase